MTRPFEPMGKPRVHTATGMALAIVFTMLSPTGAMADGANSATDSSERDGADRGVFAALKRQINSVDQTFGHWVVRPLDRVVFFDVTFWDNTDEALRRRLKRAGLTDGQAQKVIRESQDFLGRPTQVCAGFGSVDGARCADAVQGLQVPFIVLWLVLGAIYFTIRYRFLNLRAFRHAIDVIRGRYDHDEDPGEVSHFQALSSALSATVGLGNIAGVAVAVSLGGPGAVFWLVMAGFLGMSSKFAECTLGQVYREVAPDGQVMGGPMRYLSRGLGEMGGLRARLGKPLAYLFGALCIGASFGGGNMFQANQSAAQAADLLPMFEGDVGRLFYGVLLAALVGMVIIGGIRRIGQVASVVVPGMCLVYVMAGLVVIFLHLDRVGWAVGEIVSRAFTPAAGYGGMAGALIQGFRRAAFSNEAGVGSAAIAHAAAATKEPVREGIVALLEPFIDTIIVCSMTGIVVVITGAYTQRGDDGELLTGIAMTSWAFGSVLPWFPKVLSVAAFLFAFSTMLSWSYYGERCWTYMLNQRKGSATAFRLVFLIFTVFGSIIQLEHVIGFTDVMQLGMAFPNIMGVVLLSGLVQRRLDEYWSRYKSGQMVPAPARAD